MPLTPIPEIIAELQKGRFVIVVDDENRENEGDLVMAGEFATAETINFMLKFGRGLICAPIISQRADELALPLMVDTKANTALHGTRFTISVGAKHGTTTGISAADRARTVQTLANPATQAEDLSRPGHIFPLRASEKGVLERRGHTEATIDLLRMAGLRPAGVLCEILNEDGTMARLPQLETFAQLHQLKMVSIADLVNYRLQTEALFTAGEVVNMPTDLGVFRAQGFDDTVHNATHIALFLGNLAKAAHGDPAPLVRLHSECLTGDVFGSQRCDCGPQFTAAQKQIQAEGVGAILYLRQEGRGIGLMNKLKAYALQERGFDTVEANHELGLQADLRDYGVAAQILRYLGLTRVRLLTNNPNKITALKNYGIDVVERIPLIVGHGENNAHYIHIKKEKMGHMF
ncbi:MAG TPA: 3,4-dihydroxy-2-butanone-4-phosphate synthase [Anaerolineales bacterium]|nr:3,4-dihydroxy-2-butanone-4-phosphate synthase [Anaerolineales bacterium]